MPNELTKLADKYKTDKGSLKHLYTVYYYKLLNHLRYENITLFEIGVDKGYSLLMWREYFPNAKNNRNGYF